MKAYYNNIFYQLCLAVVILLSIVSGSQAATISSQTDYVDNGIGNYSFVSGNNAASSPGQVIEVLTLQSKNSESGSSILSMSSLYNTLYNGGVTSAYTLVFGFGINQTGTIGSNYVDIGALNMTFNRASGIAKTYSLGTDPIRVYNFTQGASTAEARIAVDLGFDFMQEYNAYSAETFNISSTITHTDDGAESYFLSSAFTKNVPPPVVPEPSSMILLLIGGLTLGLVGRLRSRSN